MAALGAILVEGRRVMDVCVRQNAEAAWFSGKHRELWELLYDMYASGIVIDLVTVQARLDKNGDTDIGDRYLGDCVQECTSTANATYYAEMLRQRWRLNAAENIATMQVSKIQASPMEDAEEVIANMQSEWASFAMGGQVEDNRTLGDIAHTLVEKWQNIEDNPNDIKWPLGSLNRNVGPITDELVFIAAKESTGKTALALQICVCLGFANIRTAYNSLESRRDKLVGRMIAQVGEVNTLRLRHRVATPEEWARITDEIIPKVNALPVTISDRGMTPEQIHAWARGEQARGARLLVLDNMRHVRPSKNYRTMTEWMQDLSLRLKWIRDDTGLPFMVLHHLNADGDVSWSKDIRKDADILITMEENKDLTEHPTPNFPGRYVIDFNVQKNREGQKDFIAQSEFKQSIQTFADYRTGVDYE